MRAVVGGQLVGDPLGDRLGALETAAGIEVAALPAGVQRDAAPGTAASRIGPRPEPRATLGASGHGALPEHRPAGRLRRA